MGSRLLLYSHYSKKGPRFLMLIVSIFLFFSCNKTTVHPDTQYLIGLNLKLEGKVTYIQKLNYGHDCGVLGLEIITSNVRSFDDTKTTKRFLRKIREKYASITFCAISSVRLGDTLKIHNEYFENVNEKYPLGKRHLLLPSEHFPSAYREVSKIMNTH